MVRKAEEMKEVENEKDFEYFGNLLFLDGLLTEGYKRKPTQQLKDMIIALNEIRHYVHNLQTDRRCYQKVINQYKADRLTLTRTVTTLRQ